MQGFGITGHWKRPSSLRDPFTDPFPNMPYSYSLPARRWIAGLTIETRRVCLSGRLRMRIRRVMLGIRRIGIWIGRRLWVRRVGNIGIRRGRRMLRIWWIWIGVRVVRRRLNARILRRRIVMGPIGLSGLRRLRIYYRFMLARRSQFLSIRCQLRRPNTPCGRG